MHPQAVCEIFLKDGKCLNRDCSSRHPRKCKYLQGCKRKGWCDYLHLNHQEREILDNINVTENDDLDFELMENDDNEDTPINKKCGNCSCVQAKNQSEKCMSYLCTKCELNVNNESILEFFKSHQFNNYTCNTVPISGS